MSIEFSPAFDSGRSSLTISRGMGAAPMQPAAPAAPRAKRLKPRTHGRGAHATIKSPARSSARRVAANRHNAQRSTGPRTTEGKRRASRNALKHGLCAPYACLAGECAAAYATFVAELEAELQPRTPLQRSLVPHIANLMWRIDRLPRAQADIFELELKRCAKGETLTASQVIARRFSASPTNNGFLLLGRYERGLQNQLLRLMSRYEWLKKHRSTTPLDEDEVRAAQRARDAQVDAYVLKCARDARAEDERREALMAATEAAVADADLAKRTQSNPTENPAGAAETGKNAEIDVAPVTERTHCAPAAAPAGDPCQSRPVPLASSAPKIHDDCDAVRRDDIEER